jgi:hypothetical protein
MQTLRFVAQQWLGAAQVRLQRGLARARLRIMAAGLLLVGICFGVAGAVIALAAKVGPVWALGIMAIVFLALAGMAAYAARQRWPAPITQARPPTLPAMPASEIAFLLGFIAIRAVLRQRGKAAPPKRRP